MRKAPAPQVFACSALTGDTVWNREGEDLGILKRIMIDPSTGMIAYGVLACGGVLGIGAKLFAVPWSSFAYDEEHQCFMLEVSRERLERSRGFDRERWPAAADASWARTTQDANERTRETRTARSLH